MAAKSSLHAWYKHIAPTKIILYHHHHHHHHHHELCRTVHKPSTQVFWVVMHWSVVVHHRENLKTHLYLYFSWSVFSSGVQDLLWYFVLFYSSHFILCLLTRSKEDKLWSMLGYGLDDQGSRVRFRGIFLFTTVSRTALGPTQPPIKWVPGALSLGVKRPGREADHSLPSSAEVKNAWSYTSTPPIRLHGVVLS
jgi:hypothetical protein